MAIKLTCLIFGMLLVAPSFYAAPAPETSESSEEVDLKGFIERLKLAVLTIEEFHDLYSEIMTLGPKIIKAVLDDPEVKAIDNDVMKGYTKKLRDYLEKYEQTKESDKKAHVFELVEEYDDLLVEFDSKQHPDLSTEAATIEKSLERNGLEDIQKTVRQHFESFLAKFKSEVDDYLAKLSDKEKESEKSFIEWYEKLKNEKDVDDQISLIDDFLDTDDDE